MSVPSCTSRSIIFFSSISCRHGRPYLSISSLHVVAAQQQQQQRWCDAVHFDEVLVLPAPAQLLDMYRRLSSPVERADVWRYLVLHRYGGVYADSDVKCMR